MYNNLEIDYHMDLIVIGLYREGAECDTKLVLEEGGFKDDYHKAHTGKAHHQHTHEDEKERERTSTG